MSACASRDLSVTADNSPSNTRPYQMVLWGSSDGTSSDVSFIEEDDPEPAGPFYMNIKSWQNSTHNLNYTISKIQAFVIDEPYWNATDETDDPCNNSDIATAQTELHATVLALKAAAPNALVWINFSQPEMDWQMASQCGLNFLDSNADVFSNDIYWTPIQSQYSDWLLTHETSSQKLGLVLGTFYRDGQDDPNAIAAYDTTYFDYAATRNVYAILGWSGATFQQSGVTWYGELDSHAAAISSVWMSQLEKARQ